jgi:hypothetical protein
VFFHTTQYEFKGVSKATVLYTSSHDFFHFTLFGTRASTYCTVLSALALYFPESALSLTFFVVSLVVKRLVVQVARGPAAALAILNGDGRLAAAKRGRIHHDANPVNGAGLLILWPILPAPIESTAAAAANIRQWESARRRRR